MKLPGKKTKVGEVRYKWIANHWIEVANDLGDDNSWRDAGAGWQKEPEF